MAAPKRSGAQPEMTHMKRPPIDLTATTPKNLGTTPKVGPQFKPPPPQAAHWRPTLFPKAPITGIAAFLPERQEEVHGGEDPTESSSSVAPSTDFSTYDSRAESDDDHSSYSVDSSSDHGADERQAAKDEQGRKRVDDEKKECRIDPDPKSLLPLAQAASLNFQGMGTKARRNAVERAATCRLEDGTYSVNCQGEEGEPALVLDDDEYVVDPKCDHNGFNYASTGFEGQNHFFKTMVPEQRAGYEGWPDVRPSARATNRTETQRNIYTWNSACQETRKCGILTT